MAGEWRHVTLEDVASEITVGHVGPMATEYLPEGVPFLRSQNVEYLRISTQDVKFISSAFHQRLRKSSLSPGDVVIVRTGKPGTCAVVPDNMRVANCSDLVIVRCGTELDSRFLAYYVNSAASNHVAAHLVGAVQQHFNVGSARKMRVHLPPLPEQRRIAAILGALDDKIELNRRMSQTLEEMAQAIFKSWFVDFDGHDDLVDSGLGPIPRGWEARPVGTVLELAYGKALPAETRRPGRVAVYGSGGISGRHSERLVRGPGIVVGRKGSIGTVYWEDGDFFPIDTTFYVKLRDDAVTLRWAYFRLLNMDIAHLGADSAVPGVNRNAVYSQFWCVPPSEDIVDYEKIVGPLMLKMLANREQSRTLAELRDTLLPKLVSGEVRVPEAEETIGGA